MTTNEPDQDKTHPPPPDGVAASARENSLSGALGQSLAAAAQRSGLGAVAEGQAPSGAALLAAMGGIRGLAETILPGLVFLVVYTFTMNVPLALGASVVIAIVFTVVRVIGRTPVTQAVAGLIGVGASAVLALLTGKGSDNFVLGLITNAAYALAILISLLVRWPVIGLAVGYLMGDGLAWRRDKAKYRALQLLTVCWLALFVARLAVEVPLYFADNVSGLAIAKLLMGVPLYAPLVLLSWLVVRSVYNLKPASAGS
ncbi:DUF3159 domain-containing protein [Rathayibacter soli]|uniref:DUF3159 domain-containing protein n=1 Tax=Rathayibacter soli TaxID=3144168 RepID=UPI0027E59A0F|nr:DUF3159 domain-containing protein [Glaciibacter superstes]